MTFAPLAGGRVWAKEQHGDSGAGDANEWDDESHSPGDVSTKPLIGNKTVENGRHEKVCDASSSIAKTSS